MNQIQGESLQMGVAVGAILSFAQNSVADLEHGLELVFLASVIA